eukprot:CAMPEP_0202067834 /NCGR_PEP_ID=MMETSP0963-20130614/54679_1 /ASSEMBLY_ACC=CAM_ASM_000494 /TAXON_ID=4773 /ORGANISM="Schizochytrium aggregatum, Strain ATCC28209" /LENGTH=195 /DNA_ID=CAMNT_0048634551 /DNA_START=581 /DNA_END=1170 /DNA_ORIENTATION=+
MNNCTIAQDHRFVGCPWRGADAEVADGGNGKGWAGGMAKTAQAAQAQAQDAGKWNGVDRENPRFGRALQATGCIVRTLAPLVEAFQVDHPALTVIGRRVGKARPDLLAADESQQIRFNLWAKGVPAHLGVAGQMASDGLHEREGGVLENLLASLQPCVEALLVNDAGGIDGAVGIGLDKSLEQLKAGHGRCAAAE